MFSHRVTGDIGALLVLQDLLHMEWREAPPLFISLDPRYLLLRKYLWGNELVCFHVKI